MMVNSRDEELDNILAKEYLDIQRFWLDVKLYNKYKDKLIKRLELLNTLYLLYPEIEFQVESLKGWRTKFLSYDSDLVRLAPIVHYRILPNEIVFDIDREDKKVLKEIVKALVNLGAEPFVGFSGNRGYHVHLLIGPPDRDIDGFVHHPEVKGLTQTFYRILLDLLKHGYGVDVEAVDTNVMLASSHTIRSFYSINLKGKKWKTPIFGNNYKVWYLSRNLYFRIVNEYIKGKEVKSAFDIANQINNELRKQNKWNSKKRNRIYWIESILMNPQNVIDGRRRLIMYIIVPYLLNVVGLDQNKVFEICVDWVGKTPKGLDSGIKSLIISEIKSYSKSNVFPMPRSKFFSRFPDLEYLRLGLGG